jgi:hypothetical protein
MAEVFMRHGHGTTSNSPKEKRRRCVQGARDMHEEEMHRRRQAKGGGKPDQLGVTQGQNGEIGNTVDPRLARESGKIRH